MELLFKEENIDVLSARSSAVIELEGDIPLPEGKSCTALLSAQCTLENESCRSMQEGGICIEGIVCLTLLCQDENGLYAFDSRAPFSHIHGENADEVRCCSALRAPSVKLQGGALHFSCTVEADLLLLRQETLRLLKGIEGLPEDDLQCRELSYAASRRIPGETLRLRLREEVAMPSIAEVLCAAGDLQLREYTAGENELSGSLSLALLCRDSKGRLFQSMEHVPFRSEEQSFGMDASGLSCTLCDLSVRSVGEEFGILAAEAELLISPFRLETRSCTLPVDAYAPSFPFVCNFQDIKAFCDAGTRAWRSNLDAQLHVPEGLPEISAPLYSCVHPSVTACAVENGRLFVEGILETRVVYTSANGSFYAFTDEVPFTADTPAPASNLQQVRVRALSRVSGTGRAAQAQFCLCFTASFYSCEELHAVTGISECEKTPRAAGIVVLYAGAGETLFDIAKRYNVTSEALCALQGDLQEPLEEGKQILMLI